MDMLNAVRLWMFVLVATGLLSACGSAPQAPAPVPAPPTVATVNTVFGAVTGLPNGRAQTTVTVTGLDAYSNPVANQPVSISITGNQVVVGAVTTQTITGVTNAQGVFTAILTYVAVDGVTVTATVGGVAGTTVPAPNPTVNNIIISAPVASGLPADGTYSYTINAQLLDAGNNPIANETVVFSAISAQNGLVQLSAQSAITGVTGVASVTVTDTSAVDDQVTVSVNAGTGATAITRTVVVSFLGSGSGSNTAVNGNRLSLSLNPASVPADGVTGVAVTVHAFDTYTNTNAVGVPITLRQNGRATIAAATVNTNAAGNAVFTVTDRIAETVILTAVDGRGSSTASSLTFTPYASVLTVIPSKTTMLSDGRDVVTLNITASGPQGVVPNEQIQLSSTSATTVLSSPLVITGANGKATATLTETTSGHFQITARTRNGGLLPGQVVAKITDLYAAISTPQILLDTTAAPFLADNTTAGHRVIVTVNNGAGVPQATQPITFSFSTATASSSAVASNQAGGSSLTLYSDAYGQIQLFVADSYAEATTLTATAADGTAATASLQFVSALANRIVVSPSAGFVSPGTPVTATATVLDGAASLLPNAWVQFDAYTAGGTHIGPTFALTNGNGQASNTFSLSTLGITDIYASLPLNPAAATSLARTSVQVVVPTPQIIIDTTAAPFLADGVTAGHALRITVNDAQGGGAANQPLQISMSGSAGASLTATNQAGVARLQAVTDAYGVVDLYVSDTVGESVYATVTAADGTTVTSTPFWFVAANASNVNITVDKPNANPSGVDPITATAVVTDAYGVPVQNAWVRFWTTDPYAIKLSSSTAQTAANGQASVVLTSFTTIPAADVYATLDFNGGVQSKVAISFIDAVASVQLSASVTQAQADGRTQLAVNAKVLNAAGQPLAGRVVNFSHQSNALLSASAVTTDSYGLAVVNVSDFYAETVDIYATSETITSTPAAVALTFTPMIGSVTLTALPVNGAVPADGQTRATFDVIVKDMNGNPIPNVQVLFTDRYATAARILTPQATTDATGHAWTDVTDLRPEQVTIQASVSNVVRTATVNFTATQFQFTTSSNQPFLADGVQDHYVTVTALDQYAQPVAGQVFAVSSSSTTMIPSQTQIVTGANGQAQVSVLDGVAETANLTFTATGGTLAFTVPVQFVAANAANMTITVTPSGVVNPDGVAAANLTIQVTDQNGAAVANAWVNLDAYSGGVTDVWARLGASRLLTNNAGVASTTLTRTQAGTTTVIARMPLNPAVGNQTANVQFDAPVAAVLLIPDVTQARADGYTAVNLKARVLDAAGNPLAGRSVSFSHASSATISAAALTDVYGETIVTVSDRVAENVSVTASSEGVTSVASVLTFTPLVSTMTMNILPAGGAVPADGNSPATIVVTLKDAYGAPVSGTTVQFFDDSYSSAQLSAATAISDATGTATITVKDVTAEMVSIRAVADGITKTGVVNFTLTNLQFVVGGQMPFLADGVQDHYVTVTVTDNLGNPAANQVFTISTASATMIPSQTQITTDVNGFAQVSVADSVAETANLTFTAPGGALAFTVPIQFVAADPATLNISVTPTSGLTPDGLTPATITAYVKDAYGAAVANAWVQFDIYTGTGVLAARRLQSNANGVVSTTITSTTANTVIVRASTPLNAGVVPVLSAPVTFEVPVASVLLTADQTSIDAYGSQAFATLTATALDAMGQPIAGRTTTLAVTSGTATLGTPTGTTSATGQFGSVLFSTTPGAVQVTATVGGVTSAPVTVNFLPVISSMTMTVNPATKSVVADGVSAATLTVVVKDAYGVPIQGQQVRFFDDSFSSALLSGNTVVTGLNGSAVITVSDAYAEAVNLRAVAGYNPVSWKQLSDTVQFVNSTLQVVVSGAQPFLADGNNHLLNVQVNDQNGAPVTTPQVFALSSSTTTMIPSALQVTTNALGQATVSVQDGVAETATLTLTHSATGLVFSVPVTFISADAYAMQVSVTPTTGVLPDGVSVATATVVVTDVYGAVVPNALVQFDVKDSYGNVDRYATLSAAQVMTSATGRATATVSRTQSGTTILNVSLPQTQVAAQAVGINFAGQTAQIPAKITLTSSAYTLKSDGSDSVTLTATVKDAVNVGVSGATVTFTPTSTGDAGVLSANTAVTDAYGSARVTLSAGTFDRSNRTINVTATVGTLAPTPVVPIVVSGSTVALSSSRSSLIAGDPASVATLTVSVTDAGGNPVPNISLGGQVAVPANARLDVYASGQFITSLSNAFTTWSDPYTTTNVAGQVVYDIYAVSGTPGSTVPLTVSALGASSVANFTISSAMDQFAFVSPYRTPVPSISLNGSQRFTVQVASQMIQTAQALFAAGQKADPYARVKFSSSSGSWGALNADPYIIVALSPTPVSPYGNTVSADFYSNLPGIVTIQADEYIDATTPSPNHLQDSMQLQVNATTPSVVRLTSSTTVVAPSLGGQQQQATITATVTDANNFAVANVPVTFDIYAGPGGGEFVSPVTVFTDSGGQAQTTFTSGALSSAQNGVVIQGSVFVNGQTLTGQTALTIGASAVSVSLGTSTTIASSPDGTSYVLPMSVLVTDANGLAVPGAVVSLHVRPVYFAYGHRAPVSSWYFTTGSVAYWPGWLMDNSWGTVPIGGDTAAYAAFGFAAEDRNKNQILDVVTQGAPEDGYTAVVNFTSSSSSEITDQYTNYIYTDYGSIWGVGVNNYAQIDAYVFTNQEYRSDPLTGVLQLFNSNAGYMTTRADGTPNCQPNIGGNPTNWYCASMADGALTPAQASAGSLPQSVVTDASGLGSFNLTYQKQYAGWVVVEVTATIQNTAGTESVGTTRFVLSESLPDRATLLAAYPRSPFGDRP